MTSVDYPDLTSTSASTVADVIDRARADVEPLLAASRRMPLPASPTASASEPADAVAFLSVCPVPPPPVPAPPTTPGRGVTPVGRGVVALLDSYATGDTTPTEVLDGLRERWSDTALVGGAIVARVDGADESAAESTVRWGNGTARRLEGIFVAVKDIIDVADTAITAGSHLTGDRIATGDATAVARLRAAGAIPVLVTATTEFACGAPHNSRYGVVSNPWGRDHWTGGSSTGSAAALAAGLVPLALGTDTGGSIRVPSALCNLTGIKPTYGLVPRTGVASLSWTLDHIGPMARSAADLRPVLAVLAGPDGRDPAACPSSVAEAMRIGLEDNGTSDRPTLSGVRLGVPTAWFDELCDAAVLAAWRDAVDALTALGAQMVPVEVPGLSTIHDDLAVVLTCELASNQEAARDHFSRFDIGTQVRIARGQIPSAVDYLRALRRRAGAQRAAVAAFDAAGIDVIVTPGVGATAPRLSDLTVEIDGTRHPMQPIVGRNTGVFDYLGFPAVMAPAGFAGGLPIGVQVAGRPWADDSCLRIAQVLQAVTDVHECRCSG